MNSIKDKNYKDKIRDLEMQLFFLEMKDQWDGADRDLANELNKQIKELKDEERRND